jgi:hypothetical protein
MYRLAITCVATLALLSAASARASCIYPQAPTTVPDGETATYEEMVEAHRIIVEFDTDIRHFTVCLEMEAERLMADPEMSVEQKEGLQLQLAQLNDAAVDHAEFVAEHFNEQLRIFRERDDP